jgi:hypothetical protein
MVITYKYVRRNARNSFIILRNTNRFSSKSAFGIAKKPCAISGKTPPIFKIYICTDDVCFAIQHCSIVI